MKLTALIISLFSISVAYGQHQHHQAAAKADHGKTDKKVVVKDEKLNAAYQHYMHLTSALVNSNASEAKTASSALEASMNKVSDGSAIAKTASKIADAKDLETQRSLYSELSNDFIPLVKKAGLSTGELYVDFCPMANGNKGGYWVSAQKEIKNPYFGEKMLSCGKIKETIQ